MIARRPIVAQCFRQTLPHAKPTVARREAAATEHRQTTAASPNRCSKGNIYTDDPSVIYCYHHQFHSFMRKGLQQHQPAACTNHGKTAVQSASKPHHPLFPSVIFPPLHSKATAATYQRSASTAYQKHPTGVQCYIYLSFVPVALPIPPKNGCIYCSSSNST